EFDRLNLTYTLLSKRKLLQLVQEGHVTGWDDPRMPTLVGIRRRGYTPEAIRNFCNSIGVSKTNGVIELAMLEHFVREDLNKRAPRVMAVLRPLKVVIDNYPENQVEEMDAVNNPEDPNQTEEGQDFTASLNPRSLEVVRDAKLERSLANAAVGGRYQFERLGYFCVDPDSGPRKPVFNRTVALKDTWAKIEKSSPSRR